MAATEQLESLSLIGRGLTSCAHVPELRLISLTTVCLHGNNITDLEGIKHLTRLQHLNLSSNAVTSLEGVQGECVAASRTPNPACEVPAISCWSP